MIPVPKRFAGRLVPTLLALAALLVWGPALAAVPQTIVIDGVNDFDPSNLFDADGGDTQETNFCADDPEVDTPMDIKNFYVTNDANNLYIGFEYDRECFAFPQVNLGIAFSYRAEVDGATTDAFNRKIAWNTITRKPDNYFYAVVDGFNYEVLYEWNGASWVVVQDGSDGLGMANDTGFEELTIPLSWLDADNLGPLAAGDDLYIEAWMTQDGTSKPPLDAVFSDGVQTSTAGGTTFDTTTAVEMTTWGVYTIQDATDNEPPIIIDAFRGKAVADQVVVTFNEPVDPVTATVTTNYTVSLQGQGTFTITEAIVNPGNPNQVFLNLSAPLLPGLDLGQLTVNNVEDTAGNVIVANSGYQFAVKEVVFRGQFGPYLQNNGTGSDVFAVEGSKLPLDFALVPDPLSEMVEVDPVQDIWEKPMVFSWGVMPAKAQTFTIEWKFSHNYVTFESVGNRTLILDAADPVTQTVEHFWDDLDPSAFTDKDIDVIFTVDMSAQAPVGGDTIEIAGNVPPLSFTGPFLAMVDDGTGQDAAAGDNIFTAVVSFPAGSLKFVEYKYVFNAAFECDGAGNRNLFLNDEVFDTIGGVNGPLVMPLQTYDRCNAIAGDLEVVFSVDLRNSIYDTVKAAPVVRLGGNVLPLVFDPIEATLLAADDGVAPDAVAGDLIYTASVIFPDNSSQFLEYKWIINGQFEGQTLPNRFLFLDDSFDAVGNPLVASLDDVHLTQPVAVPQRNDRASIEAYPNPFNPQTTLAFAVPRGGDICVDIFDARGRLVRTLSKEKVEAGRHIRIWDGRADDGSAVGSGVYFARVLGPGSAAGTKLVLVK